MTEEGKSKGESKRRRKSGGFSVTASFNVFKYEENIHI